MPTYEVILQWRDGAEKIIEADADETIIDATERAELGLPYGCLYGACGTCTGRLLDGDLVHIERARALKPHHSKDGYVLLCVAQPRSDCRIEVGAKIQADLVSNPWK